MGVRPPKPPPELEPEPSEFDRLLAEGLVLDEIRRERGLDFEESARFREVKQQLREYVDSMGPETP